MSYVWSTTKTMCSWIKMFVIFVVCINCTQLINEFMLHLGNYISELPCSNGIRCWNKCSGCWKNEGIHWSATSKIKWSFLVLFIVSFKFFSRFSSSSFTLLSSSSYMFCPCCSPLFYACFCSLHDVSPQFLWAIKFLAQW